MKTFLIFILFYLLSTSISFAGIICNPNNYGAIPDDNKDDYAAIMQCVSENNLITLSPGQYLSSKEISFTGNSIIIQGNNTSIKFTNPNTDGLIIKSTGFLNNIIIENLTLLTTNTDPSNNVVAISYISQYQGNIGPLIRNVHIFSNDYRSFWNYGIWLYNAWYTNLEKVFISGTPFDYSSADCGILVEGNEDSAVLNIRNSSILFYNCGIDISGQHEGTTIDGLTIVGGERGIFFHPPYTGEPQLSISNSHINVYGYGLDISNCFWFTLTNSSILVNRDMFQNPTAIWLRETIQGFSGLHALNNNIINVYGKDEGASFGVILFSSHVTVIGNIIYHETSNGSTSIWIQTENNIIMGNININAPIRNFGGDTNQIIGNINK